MQKPAALPKPREDTTRAFTLWSAGLKLADLGITAGAHRAHRFAIQAGCYFSPPLLSLDVAPPLDVCVASSIAAAARRDAAQAAFDRKLPHHRNEIVELRQQGVLNIALSSRQRMGDRHPAVTRTLQYAADIASSRNGQQMSSKSLQSRWKHEIQIALLRRRAAMARANPSARAERLLAGIIDRTLHYWGHVSPLDGGPGDHDHADSEIDTAKQDDDDDTASLAGCSF